MPKKPANKYTKARAEENGGLWIHVNMGQHLVMWNESIINVKTTQAEAQTRIEEIIESNKNLSS